MPYAEGEKKWKWWLLLFSSVFSFGMSIYSFSTTVDSYNQLRELADEYGDLILHWSSTPIQEVKYVAENVDCPKGFEEGEPTNSDRTSLQTVGQWPGTRDWCECREPQGYDFTYEYEVFECDCSRSSGSSSNYNRGCTSSEINDGCRTINGGYRDETEVWKTSAGACHRNATKAGCKTDPGIRAISLHVWNNVKICYRRGGASPLDRPRMSGDSCASGVKCGKGDYEDFAVCAASADECGITDILDKPATPGDANVTKPDRDTETTGRPIVEVRMSMGQPCLRGSEGVKGRENNPRVAKKMDAGCDIDDTRYELWDEIVEQTLYQENDIPTSGDNMLCRGGTSESGLSCQEFGPTDIQVYDNNTQVEWKLNFRREVEWAPDCQAGSIEGLREHRDPLEEMTGLQYSLMIVNGIFGLGILGIFLPCLFCMQLFDKDRDLACVPGEGIEEVQNITRVKECCGLGAKIAKFVPLIMCLIVTDAIHQFFFTAGHSECSDALTNETMIEVSGQVENVKTSNYKTLAIDVTLAVYQLIMWGYAVYKSRKDDDEEYTEKDDEEDDEMNRMEETAMDDMNAA